MDSFPYIQKLSAIRQKLVEDPSRPDPSWIRITTITMISKFLQEIDLKKFKEKFKELGSVTVRRKGSKFRGFEWKMKDTAFYNQVTIGYEDAYSRKSIKIFGNGAIQVAGCSDLFDCRRILKQLSFILASVLELEEPPPVADADVKMINTNFSLNSSVNLNKIIAKFAKVPGFKVTFDPDRYSAVKVKFVPGVGMKQVTASIFSTGRIIVTGAQTLDEIAQAYKILNENLEPGVFVKSVPEPELFGTIMGATFEEWVRVLSK
jgi:TATA-box binding protein (TBP) (component of TFIID and TFIIIB)